MLVEITQGSYAGYTGRILSIHGHDVVIEIVLGRKVIPKNWIKEL